MPATIVIENWIYVERKEPRCLEFPRYNLCQFNDVNEMFWQDIYRIIFTGKQYRLNKNAGSQIMLRNSLQIFVRFAAERGNKFRTYSSTLVNAKFGCVLGTIQFFKSIWSIAVTSYSVEFDSYFKPRICIILVNISFYVLRFNNE